tara:strand:+ start:3578 stop:4138 length:561 start_codon:yes stop_codon:yes gene_type:complete
MEDINEKLQNIFGYEKPWVYIILVVILGSNMMLDKYYNKSFIQKNGFLLAFNMVIYFSLLHIVYTFSVKTKPDELVKMMEKTSENLEIEVEVKEPIVQPYQKPAEELERLFMIFISGLIGIFFIYLVFISMGYYKINESELKNLSIGCFLIMLTICSELYLVFHVFDNPILPLCKAILKSMTNPKL